MKKRNLAVLAILLSLAVAIGATYFVYNLNKTLPEAVSIKNTEEAIVLDEVAKALIKESEANEEAKLWLEVKDIKISEAMVQGADNEYYLTHNNKKKPDRDGALFIDYEVPLGDKEAPDNLIVYGHNMENHRVFSDLQAYADKNFLENSEKIVVTDKMGIKHYYEPFLFARVDVEKGDFFPYHTWIYWDEVDSAKAYYEGMKRHSILEKPINLTKTDKLLTLSTCDNAYNDARYVLLAKEVK